MGTANSILFQDRSFLPLSEFFSVLVCLFPSCLYVVVTFVFVAGKLTYSLIINFSASAS